MITWSPQAHRIYGLIPAESAVKTETLWGIVHPDDRAAVAGARGAALAGGARYQVEHRIIRRDGALRWVLQAAAVERDDTGAPIRLVGICQDITDRKRERGRDPRRGRLQPEPDRGQPEPDVHDRPGRCDQRRQHRHRAGDRIPAGRAARHRVQRLLYRPKPGPGYELAFADGSARDYPLKLRHRDGRIISVMYNAAVFRDPAGHVLGVMAAARDITETARLQHALRASEERLRILFDSAPIGVGEVIARRRAGPGQPVLLPVRRLHRR